jgi:microcystin-dependent protein
MSFNAYIDVVNTSFSNYFTNTSNNDVVMYTDSSNQSIHLGTRLGNAPSMLKVTRSNVELNGDIALTQGVNITGLSISKRATAGTMQNVTSTVTSIPSVLSNASGVGLILGSGQTQVYVANSNNNVVTTITQAGTLNTSNIQTGGTTRLDSSGVLQNISNMVGLVLPFAGSSAPTGWLFCQGQAVSRTTYSALFTVIGSTYGVGDGSTTFNLPDLKGRVAVGAGSNTGLSNRVLAATGGEENHLMTVAEMPSHNHGGTSGATDLSHTHSFNMYGGSFTDGNAAASIFTGHSAQGSRATSGASVSMNHSHSIPSQGGGTAFNVMQPFIVMNFIIKV